MDSYDEGYPGYRPCPFTSIVWRLGATKDPGVSAPTRQVKLWMQTWSQTKERPDVLWAVNDAWNGFLSNVMYKSKRDGSFAKAPNWSKVTGVAQATIATLVQLNWKPTRPGQWWDHSKEEPLNLGVSHHQDLMIIKDVERRAIQVNCIASAKHY